MSETIAHCFQFFDHTINVIGFVCQQLAVDAQLAIGREHQGDLKTARLFGENFAMSLKRFSL